MGKNLDKDEVKKFNLKNNINFDNIDQKLFKLSNIKQYNDELIDLKPYSYWKTVAKILFKNNLFLICLVLLIALVTMSFIIPIGKQAIPTIRPSNKQASPSWQHWFGLGKQGEDYWFEIWLGLRSTLSFAFVVTLLQLSIGVILGLIWGYYRKIDILFYQVISIILVVPQLILIILIISIMGVGYWPIVVGIIIQSWIGVAASVRILVISVRDSEYNVASITLGSRPNKIIRRNILPKILPVIIQVSVFSIPGAIATESILSYFGSSFVDGIHTTSLGKILEVVLQSNEWQVYPHLIIIPIFFISIISILFFLVLKVVVDSLDPKNHH